MLARETSRAQKRAAAQAAQSASRWEHSNRCNDSLRFLPAEFDESSGARYLATLLASRIPSCGNAQILSLTQTCGVVAFLLLVGLLLHGIIEWSLFLLISV